jgi:2'-hydroxyisoflavone reductase
MESTKKLLIIGGTRQIGKRLLESLDHSTSAEWDITVFSRGHNTMPEIMFSVTHIYGDRDTEDVSLICSQEWDVVLDCVAYRPTSFGRFLRLSKDRIKRYILISTVAVYDLSCLENGVVSEASPKKKYTNLQLQAPGMRFYGECKAAIEDMLLDCNYMEQVILRPFFIVGKYDYNNLDYYWLNRIRRYEQIIIPDAVQLIQRTYLEDLVKIILHFLNASIKHHSYLSVTEEPTSIHDYLNCNMNLLNRNVSLVTVPETTLKENAVRHQFDLPYTFSEPKVTYDNSLLKSIVPFTFQKTEVIQRDIIQLNNCKGIIAEGMAGLSREVEERLIIENS